jgi:aspartate/methionine/tyrosine aminotransferase
MRTAAGGRRFFDQFIKDTPEVSCVLPDAGISAFFDLPEGTDDAQFVQRLIAERDTVVFPGHFYGTPGTARISFGGEPEEVVEGLRRLREAIRAL